MVTISICVCNSALVDLLCDCMWSVLKHFHFSIIIIPLTADCGIISTEEISSYDSAMFKITDLFRTTISLTNVLNADCMAARFYTLVGQ